MLKGRTYLSKNVTGTLNALVTGKGLWKMKMKEFFLRFRCLIFGHNMVRDIWRNGSNPQWFIDKDFEYHIGCTRCPLFRIEKP